jgi:hypothetical protein
MNASWISALNHIQVRDPVEPIAIEIQCTEMTQPRIIIDLVFFYIRDPLAVMAPVDIIPEQEQLVFLIEGYILLHQVNKGFAAAMKIADHDSPSISIEGDLNAKTHQAMI